MVTMNFHIAQMSLCLGTFYLIQGGGEVFFGTNEKLPWGCKVGQIRLCGIGYPISVLISEIAYPRGIRLRIAFLCTSRFFLRV